MAYSPTSSEYYEKKTWIRDPYKKQPPKIGTRTSDSATK